MAQQQEFIVKSGLTVETGNVSIGGTIAANLVGTKTGSVNTATGFNLSINDLLITDTTTVSSGLSVANYIGQSTINSTGTITTAVNLWISGPPIGAGSTTITDKWAVYVNTGSIYVGDSHGNPNGFAGNALQVRGGIAAGNGIFVQGGGVLEGVFFINGSPVVTQATQNTGTTYFNADVHIDTTSNSYSTSTGALVLGRTGGAGIAGNVYVGGYLAVLTTATILGDVPATSTTSGSFTVKGGVGITGDLYANSGNFTNAVVADTLQSLNTGSTSLQVGGYAQIAKGVVAQDLTLLDSSSATGYLAAPLMVTGGAYIGANLIVDSTATDSVKLSGGMMVGGDFRLTGQALFDSNINVATTSFVHGAQIITTATIAEFAVSHLTAGTDTAVSTSTGAVLVWSTATLQSLTNRGATTTNAISIANTLTVNSVFVTGNQVNSGTVHIINTTPASSQTGALVVDGGVSVGETLYVNGLGYIDNAQILTTATIGSYGVSALIAGTDTAVNTATGAVTVWNTSDLESVAQRGSRTYQAIIVDNTSSSTSTNTGALLVTGGVGIGENLNVGYTATFGGSATIGRDVSVGANATITGGVYIGGAVTIADDTNSISTDSGALQVGGGLGIGGDLWVGGTLINTNNLTVNQNFSTLGTISVRNTASSTSTSTGAITVDGGVGIGGALNVKETSYIDGGQILTTATVGQFGVSAIEAGTDIYVSSATGVVKIYDISTLDSVATRGHVTTSTIDIQNTLTVANVEVGQFLTVNDGTLLYTLTATNKVDFQSIEDSIDIYTGAVKIAGGLGVQKNIFAAGVFDSGARVVTTATIPYYAVTSLTAGTDTAVSTSTGDVIVWNTSTLQTITNRGNATDRNISINNTGSDALQVAGGAIINATLQVSGDSNLNGVNTTGRVRVNNTTQSNDTATGAVLIQGGLGVVGNVYAGALYDQSARVVTSATIGNYGVSLLVAGTDTAVNTSTGQVTVWNTSTLQTITNRGSTTTNAITINNASQSTDTNTGALIVQGGAGFGGNVNIGGTVNVGGSEAITGSLNVGTTATFGDNISVTNKSYIGGAEIVTTATIAASAVASLTAGTDTAVSTSTGQVTVWNTSTLQTVTSRGARTTNAITIANNSQSVSTLTGALVVDGGVGIGGDLFVGKSAIITGNLTVLGTQTVVDSTSTVIVDPVLDIGGGPDRTDLITNDGLNKGLLLHYYTDASDAMFVGRDIGTGKFVVKNGFTKGYPNNEEISNTGLFSGAIFDDLLLTGTSNSTSTTTGALIVDGGVGIVKDLYLGGTLRIVGDAYIGGSAVVTTGTIGSYGVTTLTAGTDTAVNTSSGRVTIWNTSTLQTVTDRGNSTTNAISILNSGTSSLTVAGGVSIAKDLDVTGIATVGTLNVRTDASISATLHAAEIYDNFNRVVTAVVPVAGDSIGVTNVTSVGTYTTFTVSNLGVTATVAGPFIGVSGATGQVTITNLGVQQAQGSDFIGVTTSTGTVQIINLGVQQLQGSTFIAVSTSTGTVQVFNAGVNEIYGQVDIDVSQHTGTIYISNTSTLQTVTGRGNSTTNAIHITNLGASSDYQTGALTVAGGVGIGGSLNVNNKSFIATAEIITTATIAEFAVTSLTVGTDTAITTSTGAAVIWSTATLQSITGRESTTTNFVHFANTTNSTGTETGSIVVDGGVGIAKDVYIGGTLFYSNSLDITSQQDSTSTTTGAIVVTGGVGIGKNLYVGGVAHFVNHTESTSTTTGGVIIEGGLGVQGTVYAQNIYSQGSLVLTDQTFKGVLTVNAGTDTAVNTATGNVVVWNTSTLQTITNRGSSTTNAIYISNVTDTFNTQSGALIVDGGVGIGKALQVGGDITAKNLYLSNTINSTNAGLYLNSANTASSVYANGVDLLKYDQHVIFVTETGNDSNDGRRIQSAFKSVKHALSVANSGDVVYIEAGTYTEAFPLTIPQGVTVKGSGLRAVIVQPTTATNQSTAFLLNGETTISDFTVRGFFKPGYALAFAPNIKISLKSPYIERFSVITQGSTTSTSDPYGFAAGDAGNGVFMDGSVVNYNSLEPAMLFNEATFIVPNATGMYMTNGVRSELLNGFFYFADKAIDAQAGTTGLGSAGRTKLKLGGVTGTLTVGDTLYYKTPGGTTLASGTISQVDGNYVYLNGACWGFDTPSTRTAKTVIPFGNTLIDTSVSKFGGASGSFDGDGDYLTVASSNDFAFSTSSWTIETWVYRTGGNGNQQVLLDFRTADFQVAPFLFLSATNYYPTLLVDSSTVIVGTSSVPLNTWTHLAVSKSGNSTRMFVNGVQTSGTYTDNNSYIQGPLTIGARSWDGANGFYGNLDDVRITKGLGRYTSNFTAPTTALVSDSDTVLMLHMNGALGSTVFADDNSDVQVIYSTGTTMSHATSIDLADYHQFGAELRCIGSAAVFGNSAVTANGTGTDLKLIAFNMSHIGSGGDLSDDVSKTVQANETIELNGGRIYYQTVDQGGDFRVGKHFLINQETGEVSFANAAVNLSNLSNLTIGTGIGATVLTPTSINVGDLVFAGDSIATQSGNLTIDPAGTSTTINSNLQVNGALTISQGITAGGSQVLTTATIAQFGVAQLSAGTDTAVSTSYGLVTVWNTSTLQTVTSRGNTTTSAINILNTSSTALQVGGGLTVGSSATIGGNATIAGAVYISNNGGAGSSGTVTTIQSAGDKYGALVVKNDSGGLGQLSITGYTTGTFRLDVGVNTDERYGFIQGWNGSTPQDFYLQKRGGNITLGNSDSSYQVFVNNRYESTSTNTGALVVPFGGVGITGNLYAGGIVFANTLSGNTATILSVAITSSTNASSTVTGALIVTGGVGIGGNLYGSAIYDNGSRVVTNATIGNVGVSSLYAGTDTAVSSQTGVVYVWNTSTLQTVTGRGNSTTNAIYISNLTSTTNLGTGALVVDGGASIGKNIFVGGGSTFVGNRNTFGSANQITVGVHTPVVGILNATTESSYQLMLANGGTLDALAFGMNAGGVGTLGTFGLNNGDLTLFAGTPETPSLTLKSLTGQVIVNATTASTSTISGAFVVSGGVGIAGNINAGGAIRVANTSYVADAQIITTATVSQFAVSSLTAGADLSVTTSTGAVTINSTGTLQSVTNRGSITSNGITISNTGNAFGTDTGALVVAGGLGIAKDGWIGGNLYVGGSAVVTEGSIGGVGVTAIVAGTDTAVSTATGSTVVWNTSTFESVTRRGSSTTSTIYINNTSSATGVLSGALQVVGGVGIGNNLYVQGTISAGAGFLGLDPTSIFQNTSSVTVTDTGSVHQVVVTISSNTNTVFNVNGVKVYNTTSSTGTNSGALVVQGGVGIGGRLNVANTSYVNGAEIVTTATIAAYGVNTIIGGTDTAVLTSGTTIYIWNTGTFQTVTDRSNTTTNKIRIANTVTGGINQGALIVDGGAYVAKDFFVGGDTTLIGNLTVLGTQTTIYSTATSIQDPVINLGAPSDLGPQATDDGLDKGVLVHYNTGSTTAGDTHSFFGMQRSSEKFVYIGRTAQQGRVGYDNPFTSPTYGGAIFGNLQLKDKTSATSTVTGALVVDGGVGIGGSIYAENTSYVNGSRILTAIDLVTVVHTATSITLDPTLVPVSGTGTSYGTYVSGDVTSIQTYGDYDTGGYYQVNDASGAPGFVVYIGFSGITEFNRAVLNINYTQSSGHTIEVDLYNYDTGAWDGFGTYTGLNGYYNFTLGVISSEPYISPTGDVYLRLYHINAGNSTLPHQTKIDYVALEKSLQGGQGPRGLTGATGAQGPQGATTSTTSTFIFFNTTTSTSTNTGAVLVYGGVGIWDSLNVNGYISAGAGIYGSPLYTEHSVTAGASTTSNQWIKTLTWSLPNVGDSTSFKLKSTVKFAASTTYSDNHDNDILWVNYVKDTVSTVVGTTYWFNENSELAISASTANHTVTYNATSGQFEMWRRSTVTGGRVWSLMLEEMPENAAYQFKSPVIVTTGTWTTSVTSLGATVTVDDVDAISFEDLTVTGTLNQAGNATLASSTSSGLAVNIGAGGQYSSSTKVVNIATGGLSGSISTVNIGSSAVGALGTFTVYSTLTQIYSVITQGTSSTNRALAGSQFISNGAFATAGDAQAGVYVLRAATSGTTSTPVSLTLNGLGVVPLNQIVLPNNATYTFKAFVTARSTNSNDEAGWEFTGVISRYANAGTTAVKVVNKNTLWKSSSTWDCNIVADTVNGALALTANSDGTNLVRFVAKVETVEVTN